MTDTEDFAALLGEFEQEQSRAKARTPQVGDKVRGTVVSIQGESVFVDLGSKTEGIAELAEFTDENGLVTVKPGDKISVQVSGADPDTGTLLLGTRHAKRMHGIEGLREAFEQQLPVEGHVSGTTKGGLEVEISGARGFCPASQVDVRFIDDLGEFVGQRLAFRITKLEDGRHVNLVLSRRAILEEEQRAKAAEVRAKLEVGAVLSGTVTSLQSYGAFVDLGGVEGMVHISELAFGRVTHPKDVLSVGQPVEVSVLRIERTGDPKRPEKIALSIRALEKDPWRDAAADYPVGSRVSGTVSRLQAFGAFIELAPGVDGLVHVSELGAGRRVSHPREVLNEGDSVEATVLSVDPEQKRISLTLSAEKAAEAAEPTPRAADYGKPKQGFGTLGDLLKESMEKKRKS